jgi:hypothetical protein
VSELTDMIDEVAAAHDRTFRRCALEEGHEVVRRARAVFVTGNPRVWWLGLRLPSKRSPSEAARIVDVLPVLPASAWFIVEDDPELVVYDLAPADVELIRKEGPAFEAYYVDKALRWLLAETDHDEFILCDADET